VPSAAPSKTTPLGFAKPDQVPSQLDSRQLRDALSAGRPLGRSGDLQVVGLRCPTISIHDDIGAAPIVLIHGLGHDMWDWAPLMAQSTALQAHVITAVDLPGFGFADKPSNHHWSLRTLVDAVVTGALQQPRPPIVIASSLGAHIAVLAALESPELFGKLVLAAPGGLIDVGPFTAATLRAHYSVESIVHRQESDVVATSTRIFADGHHPLCARLAARKLAIHRSTEQRTFAIPFAAYVDDVFRHVVRDRFASLRVPTLVVSGERDVVVPPEACETAARRLGCPFVALPGVGHTPHLESTAAFVSTVSDFLGAS
jgi:pimeloyl-ACP methyl ester carboxylesterase